MLYWYLRLAKIPQSPPQNRGDQEGIGNQMRLESHYAGELVLKRMSYLISSYVALQNFLAFEDRLHNFSM